MGKSDPEDLVVYQVAEKLANEVWNLVKYWDEFSRETVGKGLIQAVDRLCATIAQGIGFQAFRSNPQLVKLARGYLYETVHWLHLAHARALMSGDQSQRLKPWVDELSARLNTYLKQIGS